MFKTTLAFMLLLLCGVLFAQTAVDFTAPLPVDPSIIVGKLPNGLTYYIKVNHKPEHRAELRLVEKVGSVQEDADQQGLAHMTEHMAFRGTTHFPKKALVDYLDSLGMGFANDLNGYTTYDQTVYLFQFPTDDFKLFSKGFLILSDWASGIRFDTDDLTQERNVVIEEWRMGQSAMQRMNDKQDKVIYAGSRYADRMPIGQLEVLQNFKPETIKRFYHDWYRPDLQAVVAVGDFDAKQVEQLIKDNFSSIPKAVNPRKEVLYGVPDNDSTKVVIASDKEAPMSWVKLIWKHDKYDYKTLADYRRSLVVGLYTEMLNARLQELTHSAEPPFSQAFNYSYNDVLTKSDYSMMAIVPETGIVKGMTTLLTEAERVKQFGFNESELTRQKQALMRTTEQALVEKDKQESANLVWKIVDNFANNYPLTSEEQDVTLYKQLFNTITVDDINQICRELVTDKNLVVAVSAPEKPGLQLPTEAELLALIAQVKNSPLTPYQDTVSNEALLSDVLKPGKVVAEKQDKKLGMKEWTLNNGVKVLLKKTDFKADEVLLKAYSPGGTYEYGVADMYNAQKAADIVNESGVGDFDSNTLTKMLSGKIVNVQPYIYSNEEGFNGTCSKADLETMFQLVYLYSTKPRLNDDDFAAWLSRTRTYMENEALNPMTCFFDSVSANVYNHHPRVRYMKVEDLQKLDLKRIREIYTDRFGDFSDFSFIIVGNFDEKQLKAFCEKYLANLPAHGRMEKIKDVGLRFTPGKLDFTVYKGQDEKSMVDLTVSGSSNVNPQIESEMKNLSYLLNEKLRENIRVARAGAYMVDGWSYPSKYPVPTFQTSIFMECAPDRVQELSAAIISTLDSLKAGMITEKYVNVVKSSRQTQLQTDLQDNNWWLNKIQSALYNNYPLDSILCDKQVLDKLNLKELQKLSKLYLIQDKNLISGYLYPADRETAPPADK